MRHRRIAAEQGEQAGRAALCGVDERDAAGACSGVERQNPQNAAS
jgi:hypothetical protein